MKINKEFIIYLFKPGVIFKYFIYISILIISILLFMLITGTSIYNSVTNSYIKALNEVYIPEGSTRDEALIAKCKVISCNEVLIKKRDNIYRYMLDTNIKTRDTLSTIGINPANIVEDSTFLPFKFLSIDHNLLVYYNDEIYVIKDFAYASSIIEAGIIVSILVLVIFTIGGLYSSYFKFKSDILEKNSYKIYTESKVQGGLSESLHHEIRTPVTILKSVSDVVGTILDKDNKIYEAFLFSINQLDSVLELLCNGRYVKRQGENKPIEDVLRYVVSSVNLVNVYKLSYFIEYNNMFDDKEIKFDSIYVSETLGSGEFVNILTVLFTNAIEAKATMLNIRGERISNDKFWLYIKDNGVGIRDTTNTLAKDKVKAIEMITEYGYSSKNKDGKPIVHKGIKGKLFKLLGIKLMDNTNSRGVGLYMCKKLLRKANCDIELVDTSEKGTTFRISVPYKNLKA